MVPVVALSLPLQYLEDGGPNQQVREVGQSQNGCPAHFEPHILEPRHQPEWTQTLMLKRRGQSLQKGLTIRVLMKYAGLISSSQKMTSIAANIFFSRRLSKARQS